MICITVVAPPLQNWKTCCLLSIANDTTGEKVGNTAEINFEITITTSFYKFVDQYPEMPFTACSRATCVSTIFVTFFDTLSKPSCPCLKRGGSILTANKFFMSIVDGGDGSNY